MTKVRALVVEDSTTVRALLVELLRAGGVDVVGQATTGERAVALTAELRPSVVVMDIEMPGMDGLEATKRIMIETPTPIVIVTAHHDPRDVDLSLRAVRMGALALLPKPAGPGTPAFERDAERLLSVTKAMADVKVVRRRWDREARPAVVTAPAVAGRAPLRALGVAASTGGPAALYRFLEALPATVGVPVLVIQHIADGFTAGLASWLAGGTRLPVHIARAGEPLRAGTVYLAPEDCHLEATAGGVARLDDGPPVGGFRPSATTLFRSLAQVYGAGAGAVVLTGMGSDGLEGARAIRAAGGLVMAQDEGSSVVFGMPRAVIDAGLADVIGPAEELALKIDLFVPMVRGGGKGGNGSSRPSSGGQRDPRGTAAVRPRGRRLRGGAGP